MMNDEFYIGWEDKAPARHATFVRWFVAIAILMITTAALLFARSQRLIGTATFEWGNVREFSGLLRVTPYPHLVLSRESTNAAVDVAPLVAPFKFGIKHEAICGFDGQVVKLRGTRIHRDGELMLEVEPDSVTTDGAVATSSPPVSTNVTSLGHQFFEGEIVDSKCRMGVMNPGVLTPHRACAVRCISGGIPPMLLVRRVNDRPLHLLLVSTNDQPVNAAVLDFVAEPIRVTGELVRNGPLLMFRINPAAIRRL